MSNYFDKLQCQYIMEDWLHKYDNSDLTHKLKLKIVFYKIYEMLNLDDKKFINDYLKLRQDDSCLAALGVIEGFKTDIRHKVTSDLKAYTNKNKQENKEQWISIL